MTTSADSPAPTRALVSPNADFWLVGGASVVTFMVFVGVTEVARINLADKPLFWVFYVSFLISNPHFVFSYLLFYRGFWQRLKAPETERLSRLRMIVAGIIVPAVMTGFMLFAMLRPDKRYVDWAVAAMVFSVGWHYVKQAYGVLITLSLYEGVLYSLWEKRVLWLSGYATWLLTWICGLALGINIFTPGAHMSRASFLPQGFDRPALAGIFLALPAAAVLVRHYMKGGGMSANAVTGYACGAWMWIMMPFINPSFVALVPIFHGLQYLPFVYKMKRTEFGADYAAAQGDKGLVRQVALRAAVFTLLGIAFSVLLFEYLPRYLDAQAPSWHLNLSAEFFLMMVLSFVNIHHYFMDSAFWRRDNAEVQKNLFRA